VDPANCQRASLLTADRPVEFDLCPEAPLPNFPLVLPASFCVPTHGLVLVAPGRAGGPSPLRDGIAKLGDCLVHNSTNARKARVAVLRDADEVLWYSIYGSLPIAHVPSVSGTPTPAFAPPGAGVDPNPGSAKVM
jgi:hypothetical protein